MIFRDQLGYLRQVPDEQFADGFGQYPEFGEMLYDGLGNPLGLPFLATLIPAAAAALPGIISSFTKPRTPALPWPPQPIPLPAPNVIQSPAPMPPSIYGPTAVQRPVVVYRRRRARRAPFRLRVPEPVTVPPAAEVHIEPPPLSVLPPEVEPVPPSSVPPPEPPATESSGGVSGYGWFTPVHPSAW